MANLDLVASVRVSWWVFIAAPVLYALISAGIIAVPRASGILRKGVHASLADSSEKLVPEGA